MSGFELKEGVFRDIPSDVYHGTPNTFSSSQLKDMDDPELFHRKHVLKAVPREEKSVFDQGTYLHTAILEPHKIEIDCAVFEGTRRGKVWDDFKAAHAGKAIITKTEADNLNKLVKVINDSPVTMGRIRKSESEVSAFVKLLIYDGVIYAGGRHALSIDGWYDSSFYPDETKKDVTTIWVKVRADKLGDDFILDLKSTTGNAKDKKSVRNKIFDLQYDLSATFYLDIFEIALKKPMKKFIWSFASKDYLNCMSYTASEKLVKVGRKKWMTAMIGIAYGMKTGWAFEDYMGEIDAPPWESEIIQPSAEDAL